MNTGSYYVFEVYQDEAAYALHRESHQFKNYVDKAGSKLTERIAFDVRPQFLQEKLKAASWDKVEDFLPQLARVVVQADKGKEFETSVIRNMQESLDREAGVLAMYALREIAHPNHWYFFEVYADQEAYVCHRQEAHFKRYLAETEEWVQEKELIPLKNSVSMTQGRLF